MLRSSSAIGAHPMTRYVALAFGFVVFLAAGLVGSGVANAATTEDENSRPSLVGTWVADVVTSIPSTGQTTIRFNADGTVTPVTGSGTGTWTAGQGNRFSFDLEHPVVGSGGEVTGNVVAHQDGNLLGEDRFSSSGDSTTYDLNGTVVRSFTVELSAVRQPS